MRGTGEGGFHLLAVAVVIVERDVVGCLVIEHGRARLRCRFGIGDGVQRLDVELDRFGGVLGLQQGLGHHDRRRVADIADFVGRERMAGRLLHLAAVAVLERHDALERAIAGEVRRRIDAEHTLHPARGVNGDAAQDAVGMAAAHDHRIGLPGQAHVVGEAPFAPHQHRVLAAQDRLADAELGEGPLIVVVQIHRVIRRKDAPARQPLMPARSLNIGCVWMSGEGGTRLLE